MTKGDWNQRQKVRRVSDTRGANGHAETRRKTMGEGAHRDTETQRKTKGGRDGARGDAETRRRTEEDGRQGCRGLGGWFFFASSRLRCEVWSSGSGALLGTGRLRSAECECRWISQELGVERYGAALHAARSRNSKPFMVLAGVSGLGSSRTLRRGSDAAHEGPRCRANCNGIERKLRFPSYQLGRLWSSRRDQPVLRRWRLRLCH
jgi:hypothetical protein